MKRPILEETSLDETMRSLLNCKPGFCVITMGIQQWDRELESAYNMGWSLLEVDENEMPIRAYKRKVQ